MKLTIGLAFSGTKKAFLEYLSNLSKDNHAGTVGCKREEVEIDKVKVIERMKVGEC